MRASSPTIAASLSTPRGWSCAHACAAMRMRWNPHTAPSSEALRHGRAITPAAQWLVDNFHVVSEQLSEVSAAPYAQSLA